MEYSHICILHRNRPAPTLTLPLIRGRETTQRKKRQVVKNLSLCVGEIWLNTGTRLVHNAHRRAYALPASSMSTMISNSSLTDKQPSITKISFLMYTYFPSASPLHL